MLEESVKKLKSPNSPPSHVLRKEQVDAAFDLLADWYYEVCGSVAFSSLEHPKFAAFLRQVGLPEVSKRELLCSRLDSKFEEARRASEARIRDAAFFQIASDGWNIIDRGSKSLVKFVVNLPNGTRVFQKAVYSNGGQWRSIIHGFCSLIKDFNRELPLFGSVAEIDIAAVEVDDLVQDVGFWSNVEAVHSLIKLVTSMAEEVEADRPLVGQCLPLWGEMRSKIKELCTKYNLAEGPVERCLTHEQEKDVDKLVTRLVAGEEAHIALMELMKWRSEGLDPLYAQAVQLKQQDPVTRKMKMANPQSSRLVWETCLKEFKSLSKVAVRLLFLQATSGGNKCDWSFTILFRGQGVGFDKVQKLVFVAAHTKLERQDFSSVEENDAVLLRNINGEDEMLNEAPSI
ncbi:hypothetical protein SASPL_157856 [Salvia splendens]|uniref:Uncharacterized protein n=1 Tax=Salvia splendens TaxID=180675 RepID=A0A8X8VU87_SALSN|nr:hypothetical protein SASPL_157856 [Salvia splendens]